MSHAIRDLIRAQVQEAHDSGDSRREAAARVQLEANDASAFLEQRAHDRAVRDQEAYDAAVEYEYETDEDAA